MPVSDSSLGPYLRSEREQQGIALQDIAELTKIQPKFIEAIEDDAYDRLPKGPFVIGFLRSYAECLSIDPDEVVSFYQSSFGVSVQRVPLPHDDPTPPPQVTLHSRAASSRGGRIGLGVVAIACLLMYAMWSGFFGSSSPPDLSPSPANEAPVAQPPTSPPASLPVESVATTSASTPSDLDVSPAADAPQVDSASSDQPTVLLAEASAPVLAPLVLRVYALERTWMRLDIDSRTSQEAMINASESATWEAREQFSLTIGNVKGARVFLNEQELDLPETRSNVLRDYVLTRALLTPRQTN